LTIATLLLLELSGVSCVESHSHKHHGANKQYVTLDTEVMETLHSYILSLNGLAGYSSGPDCNFARVNLPALTVAARNLVDTFFSKQIRSFVVRQITIADLPTATLLANISLGAAPVRATGQPAITTSAVLFHYLKSYFASSFGFSFSSPSLWNLSTVAVTINNRDPVYGNQMTAYVEANGDLEGFLCSEQGAENRSERRQLITYRSILAKEYGEWKYIRFGEDLSLVAADNKPISNHKIDASITS